MKTKDKLKKLIEQYLHPSKGSARFAAKHKVSIVKGSDDFDSTRVVKAVERFKHRHGYDTDNTSKLGVKDYHVYEGVDPFLNELSSDKIGQYHKAATAQVKALHMKKLDVHKDSHASIDKKIDKRASGAFLAGVKMYIKRKGVKEEVITELSKETLKSYFKAARKDKKYYDDEAAHSHNNMQKIEKKIGKHRAWANGGHYIEGLLAKSAARKSKKRATGLNRAADRLAKD